MVFGICRPSLTELPIRTSWRAARIDACSNNATMLLNGLCHEMEWVVRCLCEESRAIVRRGYREVDSEA